MGEGKKRVAEAAPITTEDNLTLLAFEAADLVVNDWETQMPIINGMVKTILNEENTIIKKVYENGQDVEYRMSRGNFKDSNDNEISLVTRMPIKGKKRSEDFDYILGSAKLIVNGNLGYVAATVHSGNIMNNDDALTVVLPKNPVGFTKMFSQILRSSEEKAREVKETEEHRSQQRRRGIRKGLGRLVMAGVVASIGIFGVPKVYEEYHDYEDKEAAKDAVEEAELAAQRAAAAEEAQRKVNEFDTAYPLLEDGLSLEDDERALVPATNQFAFVDEIPGYSRNEGAEQLEHVRSLPISAIGTSFNYRVQVPEGKTVAIAHTGSADLTIVARLNEETQSLAISTVDLSPQTPESPTPPAGEIVITLVDK